MVNNQVNVLVVDDSVFMRKMISDILNDHDKIKVTNTASNGQIALETIAKHRPDVITLDVEMPKMNGIEALKIIQKQYQIPVVMLSSLTQQGAQTTLQALELGAFDFISKPSGSISFDIKNKADEIKEKVLQASTSKSQVKRSGHTRVLIKKQPHIKSDKILVIGVSTGGPKALKEVIPFLPGDLPVPVLVVQHMPPVFTNSLAKRLDSISNIKVKEAEHNERIRPGVVYIAPGNHHMCLDAAGKTIELNQEPTIWGVRPAVDITLASAIKAYKNKVISVIMTGMGHDGSHGAKALKKAGGFCIAQDEETSTVYGMPKTVIDAGNANVVVSLYDIAKNIVDKIYEK